MMKNEAYTKTLHFYGVLGFYSIQDDNMNTSLD